MKTPEGHRIEYIPLDSLQGALRNPKKHAERDVQRSIGRFGYVEPIIIDERTQRLVAGHGRKEALEAMHKDGASPPSGIQVDDEGRWLVPVMRGWTSRSDQEAQAYLLASNRLSEAGGWHDDALAEILAELQAGDALDGLGFDDAFLTKLLDENDGGKVGKTDPDDVPAVPDGPLRVALGDVWLLGEHRIVCGDCTDSAVTDALLGAEKADLMWTDPPYGVSYVGKTKEALTIQNDGAEDLDQLLLGAFRNADNSLKPGAPIYVAHAQGPLGIKFETAFVAAGWTLRQQLIWLKPSMVLGHSDYHYRHEPILYGYKPAASGRLGRGGVGWFGDNAQTSVFEVEKPTRSESHPTMKPVELIVRALKNSSARGAVCFEPFSGSGSTLIACEKTGRKCRAVELEPKYVQVAVERWEAFTGRIARKG